VLRRGGSTIQIDVPGCFPQGEEPFRCLVENDTEGSEVLPPSSVYTIRPGDGRYRSARAVLYGELRGRKRRMEGAVIALRRAGPGAAGWTRQGRGRVVIKGRRTRHSIVHWLRDGGSVGRNAPPRGRNGNGSSRRGCGHPADRGGIPGNLNILDTALLHDGDAQVGQLRCGAVDAGRTNPRARNESHGDTSGRILAGAVDAVIASLRELHFPRVKADDSDSLGGDLRTVRQGDMNHRVIHRSACGVARDREWREGAAGVQREVHSGIGGIREAQSPVRI